MKKRALGKSGLPVSRIALGAWAIGGWMWGGSDKKDSLRAIESCLDYGITSIDTAPVYGFGHSEKVLGEAIKGKRDRYEILTKCGMRWEGNKGEYFFTTNDNSGIQRDVYKYSGKESIIAECEESLLRLGTDYIDLYQIHWPDHTTPIKEAMEAFSILLQQGKIKAAGVSNYSVEQMDKASGVVELSSNQVPYSMVRREIEEDVVPWCLENDCGILAYSPLQRGLLTGKITPDYPFAPGDSRPETSHFKINNLIRTNKFLEKINPMAQEKGVTLSQLVIAWTLLQPGITVALVGARTEEQVKQNAGALDVKLSADEMELISKELDKLELELE
ncbi:MAG: aldo/keto reductase [Bacteroidia bacterium]|nr:MAG: aldo/keto reductase [Bacteroidia bacterium]